MLNRPEHITNPIAVSTYSTQIMIAKHHFLEMKPRVLGEIAESMVWDKNQTKWAWIILSFWKEGSYKTQDKANY